MIASTLTFESGRLSLVGSLRRPDTSAAAADVASTGRAALLISGSGPIDRDSNSRKLEIDVMRQVAARLARSGVTSLRYDKRGVGASDGDFHAAGFHDNVDDARAALAALRAQPDVDPRGIVLVGHSEGANIAVELAADDDRLAGVVLLAGSSTTGEVVLREQAVAVGNTLPKPVRWLLKLLRQDVAATQDKRLAQLRATTRDTVRIQLVKVNAKWFREFLDHDPAESLAGIDAPVLVIAGTKDLQVAPHHAAHIGQLLGGVARVEVVEDMSHLLRHEPGPASVRSYRTQVKQPVLPELLDLVAAFCAQPTARRTPSTRP